MNGTGLEWENSYVAIDLETTGLSAKKDRIIEIGAVRVLDGQEAGQYHTMVNPRRVLEERIRELTGITEDMVENAPDIGDIIGEVVDFCGELPLLGHHVIFDYSFLKQAAVNQRLVFEKKGIDTLKLCRRFMPEEEKKNLDAACSFFEISRGRAHRALEDALYAHYLYQKLVCRYLTEDLAEDGKEGEKRSAGFKAQPLIYKVKREQPASKRQKEDLRYLVKYHKIDLPVQIEALSRNEASRLKDQILSQYGRI